MKARWFGTFVILVILLASFAPLAGAAPSAPLPPDEAIGTNSDDGSDPLSDKQAGLRERGFEAKLEGKTHGKVHEVSPGQFVELSREGEDKIFTVLGEFGNTIHPIYGGTPGPLHNQIPQ